MAADGAGLNPLLQYPEMVIHPPMLYLGYVGFSVPFAFALGALMMRYPGEKWIHITRRWTMVTWLFLTCGIFLGAHWAYSVLGWGGYWGWDPVENASLMPWLTGTAFLHSVMMQEKRGMMKNWNVWLIFSTFLLTILGTLLTRSGIISSVHAFAQSPIGAWFYTFIVIVFLVCLITFFLRRDHLKSENKLESLVSRESSFLFNNMILLAACVTVLWGTLFPLLSEAVTGSKVTMGAPYYNRVNIPIGLFLLFLTGIGPLLAWRSTTLRSIRRNFVLPSIAMAVTAVGADDRGAASVERWRRHAVHLLLADRVYAGGGRDYGDCRGVHARGQSGAHADGQEPAGVHGAADAAQYAALRRVHHPLRNCGDVHRHCGRRVQPGARDGDELRRYALDRAVPAGLRGHYAGLQAGVRHRLRAAGCV